MGKFSDGIDFERSDKYGWVTMNINLLGTGICCKIRLKLQHSLDHIENIAQRSGIKINLIDANQCENGFIVELINQRSFGLSEFACVQQFYKNIKKFMEMMETVETQNDTVEKSNEINTCESNKNVDESSEANVEADINETENPTANENDTPNQDEQSEQKIDTENPENVGNAEMVDTNIDTAQNDSNEAVANTEGNIDEKTTDGDNTTNILESNNTNEHNTDNTVENEMVEEEKKMDEIAETAPNEPNEMENIAPEQPIPTEDQDIKEADNQPIEV